VKAWTKADEKKVVTAVEQQLAQKEGDEPKVNVAKRVKGSVKLSLECVKDCEGMLTFNTARLEQTLTEDESIAKTSVSVEVVSAVQGEVSGAEAKTFEDEVIEKSWYQKGAYLFPICMIFIILGAGTAFYFFSEPSNGYSLLNGKRSNTVGFGDESESDLENGKSRDDSDDDEDEDGNDGEDVDSYDVDTVEGGDKVGIKFSRNENTSLGSIMRGSNNNESILPRSSNGM
jgi:hypothetical protein